MSELGLYESVIDQSVLARAVARFRERQIRLPTFAELADPSLIARDRTAGVDPDLDHPANLFRLHWHNDRSRAGRAEVPEYLEVPSELSGVPARIVLLLGNRFPMIRAHKVLAAYACLAPRVATGAFDPANQRAIWPSTGNYARGGVAISRIMDSHGVAVLPEGMSRERFAWLAEWITSEEGVVRTPGTESNVKEVFDACRELATDPRNVVLNQFAEFGNHLVHFRVTGPAIERVWQACGEPTLRALVAASGSAGTLAAGDYLKERHACRIVPVEALECPTMLYNGYGEHNIQGIGDKHIPLIHNVMNSDDVVGVTDRATDALLLAFNTEAGREALTEEGVGAEVIDSLSDLGLSAIANLLASIRVARHYGYGPDDMIATVATDGAEMYGSEIERIIRRDHPDGYERQDAIRALRRHLTDGDTGEMEVLSDAGRRRIFNLGYYTWVEQQQVPLTDFEKRRQREWWIGLRRYLPLWDNLIDEFNERTGA